MLLWSFFAFGVVVFADIALYAVPDFQSSRRRFLAAELITMGFLIWFPVAKESSLLMFSFHFFRFLVPIYLLMSVRSNVDLAPMSSILSNQTTQTLSVLATWPLFVYGIIFGILFLLSYWTVLPTILYIGYIWLDKSPQTGGWKKTLFTRSAKIYKHTRDYFPVRLIKTVDIPAGQKYVMGYHPHGILSIGGFINFATEATDFSNLFPGIDLRVLSLNVCFRIPMFREWLLTHGFCDVSRKSIQHLFTSSTCNAVMIVVGGAQEAIRAVPGTMTLFIKERKGFVKLAIEYGANLVPVLSFGENDLFRCSYFDKSTFIGKCQTLLKRIFSYSLPIFHGVGVTNLSFGLLPYRHHITAVVGSPIEVLTMQSTDIGFDDYVNKIHTLYVQQLSVLYDKFKDELASDRQRELLII